MAVPYITVEPRADTTAVTDVLRYRLEWRPTSDEGSIPLGLGSPTGIRSKNRISGARRISKRGADFDEAYSRAELGVAKILASALLTKFLTARDRAIAHYEMRGGKDGPELFKEGDGQCSLFVVSKGNHPMMYCSYLLRDATSVINS